MQNVTIVVLFFSSALVLLGSLNSVNAGEETTISFPNAIAVIDVEVLFPENNGGCFDRNFFLVPSVFKYFPDNPIPTIPVVPPLIIITDPDQFGFGLEPVEPLIEKLGPEEQLRQKELFEKLQKPSIPPCENDQIDLKSLIPLPGTYTERPPDIVPKKLDTPPFNPGTSIITLNVGVTLTIEDTLGYQIQVHNETPIPVDGIVTFFPVGPGEVLDKPDFEPIALLDESYNPTEFNLLYLAIILDPPRHAIGGEMFPVDTTALLLAATYSTASWMIPLMIAAVGFGIIITHQKTKLKYNSCPSCKLETEDFFELGDKVVSKCDNPKCRVNLFFIRRYRNSFK